MLLFLSGWPETIRHGPLEIDLSLKTPKDPLVYQNLLWTPSNVIFLKINSPFPVDFINKGNTCYANAILQTLSVVPSLWNRVLSQSPSLSPFLISITLNVKIKFRSKKPVYPWNFLWVLTRKILGLIMYHLVLTVSKMMLRWHS